jgi:hypothetical protein
MKNLPAWYSGYPSILSCRLGGHGASVLCAEVKEDVMNLIPIHTVSTNGEYLCLRFASFSYMWGFASLIKSAREHLDRLMSEKKRQLIDQRREPHLETMERARAIHSALSNQDGYEILCLAAYGINAGTSILREQSFSRKRYYLRLKVLVDLGLVHKDDGKYKHTDLGRMVYENQLKSLETTLEGIATTKGQV